MARLPRLSLAGLPHHVIQRGNDRQLIFRDAEDHVRYLQCLRDTASEQGVAIHAYVLMPNHVHLLATPATDDALARVMQSLGRRYVRWFNDRHGRTGTLWEGRFRSAPIEAERYLLACSRYIEMNPVRAGLAAEPASYPWSSHAHHIGRRIDLLVTDHSVYWGLGNTPFDRQAQYRSMFELDSSDAGFMDRLRDGTNRGWALGSDDFLGSLRVNSSRPMTPKPRGRPKKSVESVA
ncbi:MAG: transposase [Burkholderiaceae bacterium]